MSRPNAARRGYDAIEAELSETEAGRAFLLEHARRSRGGEVERLLGALDRLRSATAAAPGRGAAEAAEAIRTALCGPVRGGKATGAVGELARALARALRGAEALQDLGWGLRERGADAALCARLDGLASELYAAAGRGEAALLDVVEQVGALDRLAAALRPAQG